MAPTTERIENRILLVRGQKVLIDKDLATLYGVENRPINQAVKGNADRLPADFMFRLTEKVLETWRSQVVISKSGPAPPPFAFARNN